MFHTKIIKLNKKNDKLFAKFSLNSVKDKTAVYNKISREKQENEF